MGNRPEPPAAVTLGWSYWRGVVGGPVPAAASRAVSLPERTLCPAPVGPWAREGQEAEGY